MKLQLKASLIVILMLIIAFGLAISGCSNDSDLTDNDEEAIEKIGEIIITGSPTLGQVLTQLTVEFTEKYLTWDKVDPTFPEEEINIVISGGGTGAGVNSVIEKTSNFGLISRNVSQEEKAKFEVFNQYDLGIDALTISVNYQNKISEVKDNFTGEEVRAIFAGEYKYWSDIDPSLPKDEIVLVTRDVSGGAHEVFRQKIMGDVEVSPNVIQAPSMGALVTKIAENKNAIGYASFGVAGQNEGTLTSLTINGVAATRENIINGSYDISRPLLLISNGDLSAQEQVLVDFLTSERSAEVFNESGFVTFD